MEISILKRLFGGKVTVDYMGFWEFKNNNYYTWDRSGVSMFVEVFFRGSVFEEMKNHEP